MTAGRTARRVVVTGIGVVAPGGTGREAFWELITAGRPATRRITLFDPSRFRSRIAAEGDFDPVAAGLTPGSSTAPTGTPSSRWPPPPRRSTTADCDADRGRRPGRGLPRHRRRRHAPAGARVHRQRRRRGPGGRRRPRHALRAPGDAPGLAGRRTRRSGTACTARSRWSPPAAPPASTRSATPSELIREGEADVMLAGASDAPISPITVACFDAIKATTPATTTTRRTPPGPFDADRNGFVLGEGAAVLVLEELEHARAPRRARLRRDRRLRHPQQRLPHDRAAPGRLRDGRGDQRRAATRPGIDPEQVDYVNAHGSGTKQNDRHETAAFKRALGEHAYRVPVSSIKSMVGHSLGAIGAIEIAACALAIEHGVVPPTANLRQPDPRVRPGLRPGHRPRTARCDTVLSVGSGFGGFQSAMVLARPWSRSPHGSASGMTTRAVITGLGVAAPNGARRPGLLGGHRRRTQRHPGRRRARRDRLPPRLAGEITGFDAARSSTSRCAPQTDRRTRLALAAAEMALDDAALGPPTTPLPYGGGHRGRLGRLRVRAAAAERRVRRAAARRGGDPPVPRLVLCGHHRPDLHPARAERSRGVVVAADGAGGLDVLEHAWRLLRRGGKAVIVGGTGAPLPPCGPARRSTPAGRTAAPTPNGPTCPSARTPRGSSSGRAAR